MKRILIFSDTHGYTDPCIRLIQSEPAPNAVIHAGDCVRDVEDLEYIFPDIPFYYVSGNNDLFTRARSSLLLDIEGVRIFVAHGHEHRVKYEYEYTTFLKAAQKKGASLAIFGHTHKPYTDYRESVTLLNPGSVRFSHTYAVAEINKGTFKTQIIEY